MSAKLRIFPGIKEEMTQAAFSCAQENRIKLVIQTSEPPIGVKSIERKSPQSATFRQETSRKVYRRQLRSGVLLAHLSLGGAP